MAFWAKNFILVYLALILLGCAVASTIQRADQSESAFNDAVYEGKEYNVGEDLTGAVKYRVFHQASTGFTSIQSVRVSATERAVAFCTRKNMTMQAIKERTSVPPHILGNFPRIEIIFACVESPIAEKAISEKKDKYEQLRELKSLLDDGVLTQKEFEAEKNKILNNQR